MEEAHRDISLLSRVLSVLLHALLESINILFGCLFLQMGIEWFLYLDYCIKRLSLSFPLRL